MGRGGLGHRTGESCARGLYPEKWVGESIRRKPHAIRPTWNRMFQKAKQNVPPKPNAALNVKRPASVMPAPMNASTPAPFWM